MGFKQHGLLKSPEHIVFNQQYNKGRAVVFQISMLLKALSRWL
jgi:hypothetical protein